jgi:hypothetical protein
MTGGTKDGGGGGGGGAAGIKVTIRVRPLLPRELMDDEVVSADEASSMAGLALFTSLIICSQNTIVDSQFNQ